MADQKISALTSATTPLAGTEVLPIVQSGVTKKVSVADLTAGRTVAAAGLDVSSSGSNIASLAGGAANGSSWYFKTGTNVLMAVGDAATITGGAANAKATIYTGNAIPLSIAISGADRWSFDTSYNLVPLGAAKGVNFTANTPAAGMTSQLLNWYEEGTWTPGLDVNGSTFTITSATTKGNYRRVGKQVTVWGRATWSAFVNSYPARGFYITQLPFAPVDATGQIGAMSFGFYGTGLTIPAGYASCGMALADGTYSQLRPQLTKTDGTATTSFVGNDIATGGGDIYFWATYTV